MDRRLTGALVLIGALIVALVVPQILRPGIPGEPSAAPFPLPPAIGTCVDSFPRSFVVVECAEPHDGEIFATWPAGDPDRPRGRDSPVCTRLLASDYSGRLPTYDGWQLTVLNAVTAVIRAPAAERVGQRGWTACVLRPANSEESVGSVGTADTSGTGLQGVFGNCLQADGRIQVPCTEPHPIERLAVATGATVLDNAERDANGLPIALVASLTEQCLVMAGELTGNPDPTFGGRLTVRLAGESLPRIGEVAGSSRPYAAECVLDSGDQLLTGSVIGIGEAPLPVG